MQSTFILNFTLSTLRFTPLRFQVPQFIETEIKLIGPMTLKQFLWVGGGGTLIFLILSIFPNSAVAVIAALLVGAVSVALAFLKINDEPLFNYFAYSLYFLLNPKKYIYKSQNKSNLIEK